MKKYIFIFLLLISGLASSEEDVIYYDVIRCQSFPKLVKKEYYLKNSDIKYPEQIRKVIPELMRLDLVDKIDAIGLVLPEDWHDSEGKPYEIRLNEYIESPFSRQASCLVENYKEGDRLYHFSQNQKGSYDKGYVLFRGKDLVAVVVTEGIRI